MYKTLRCDSKLLNRDLEGNTYIVTGANSGVGLATTTQLVKQGAHVIMACRRIEAGKKEAFKLNEYKGTTEVVKLDLADLDSVKLCADEIIRKYNHVDGLVNNAGMCTFGREPEYTKSGFEMIIGVNHIGHFLFTELLLDLLQKSAPSRIVCLSSLAHTGSEKERIDIHFEDLHYKNREFSAMKAYGEAKLAVLLYAKELGARLEGTGVTAVSVHPGWARSNLGGGGVINWMMNNLLLPFAPLLTLLSNNDAAQTSLHCLLDNNVVNHSGEYYSQNGALYPDKHCRSGGWPLVSPNPNANDIKKAKKLVEVSYEMVKDVLN